MKEISPQSTHRFAEGPFAYLCVLCGEIFWGAGR
jgi:hypothetical protein